MPDADKTALRGLSSGHLILSLRAIAVVTAVFGLTCLGVLVVVTSVKGKDALSTVALALAILAFSVQLIVFVAQQSLATEQGRRSEELYGSMQGVLAEIREKTAGTQAEVRTINEKMLGAILAKNLVGAPVGQLDYEDLGSQIAQAIDQSAEKQNNDEENGATPIWPARRPDPNDGLYVQQLESFPSEEEVGDALSVVESLEPSDRERLKSFGDDEILARHPDSPFDPSLTAASVGGLESLGLVEPYPPDRLPTDGFRIFRLTDHGRAVARLLTASGDPPPYLEGLKEIRDGTPDRLDWQRQLRD